MPDIFLMIGSLIVLVTGAFFLRRCWNSRKQLKIIACFLTTNEQIINVTFKINKNCYAAKKISKIYGIDEASGIVLPVLSPAKLKNLHIVKDHRGKYCYIMLKNRNHAVIRGSKITIVIAGYVKKHVCVA